MQKPVEVKKQRTRRPPEMIAELIMEAERSQNQAAICRRENICPQLFSRWKSKFKEAGVEALKEMKRGRKPKSDPKVETLERY
jgi:transposase